MVTTTVRSSSEVQGGRCLPRWCRSAGQLRPQSADRGSSWRKWGRRLMYLVPPPAWATKYLPSVSELAESVPWIVCGTKSGSQLACFSCHHRRGKQGTELHDVWIHDLRTGKPPARCSWPRAYWRSAGCSAMFGSANCAVRPSGARLDSSDSGAIAKSITADIL